MRQTSNQEGTCKRRGNYGARIICAIIATVMVMSMSVSVFAEEIRHGRGSGRMLHKPDGTMYTSRELTDEERELYLDWEAKIYDTQRAQYTQNTEMHVMHIAVGETVVLHAAQETIQFNEKGVRTLYRWYLGDEPSVGFKTVAGIEDLNTYTKSNLFHVKSGGQDYYCLEWYVTGVNEGTDYIWYFDNPFEPQYLMIVVGEGSDTKKSSTEKKAENTTTTSESKNTEKKNSSSAPATTASSASSNYYTVQAGDTWAKIALNAYGDMNFWPELQQANSESLAQTKNGLIFEGMVVYLPDDIGNGRIPAATAGAGEKLYTVQAGDSYGSIALAHFGDASRYKEIWSRNSDRIKDVNTLFEGQIIVLP